MDVPSLFKARHSPQLLQASLGILASTHQQICVGKVAVARDAVHGVISRVSGQVDRFLCERYSFVGSTLHRAKIGHIA